MSAVLLWVSLLSAQERVAHLSGEVFRGQEFRREIGSGLFFVLGPSDTGWIISIEPKTACITKDDDWAYVVNAPYRNYSALRVDASYGITAKEAVSAMNPRKFSFVVSCADYRLESHRVQVVLWPGNYPPGERDAAFKELATSPQAKAEFTILDSKVSPAAQDIEGKNYGKIDWLKFRLDVQFPTQ